MVFQFQPFPVPPPPHAHVAGRSMQNRRFHIISRQSDSGQNVVSEKEGDLGRRKKRVLGRLGFHRVRHIQKNNQQKSTVAE
jgi:hypothetical protein